MSPDTAAVQETASTPRDRELLATKLYVPQLRRALVPRPSLVARVEGGTRCKLTLVSAPAGFGKTTLIADWVAEVERPVAWLSVDAGDNDPVRFLAYLVAALQTIDSSWGEEVLTALESLQPLQPATLLTGLLNEIGDSGVEPVIVLDDYHLIGHELVHETVRFLVDNSPPALHLIIITREDPPWPLGRLRAGGDLNEIRGRDLRFTLEETAAFCNDVMGLNMAPEDIRLLDERAEGWVAGLQMAALSIHGTGDMSQLVGAFSGSNRYVLDYLLEEVLSQQPPDIQHFLLQTAVLDRLCAPLCDALLEVEGGTSPLFASPSQTILEQLEGANLFIVPLDEERHWYRYHHLFSGLLRARLQQTAPQQEAELHRIAAGWFSERGLTDEAIGHALGARDYDLAANLLEQEGLDLVSRHKMVSLARWLETVPAEMIEQRPWLSVFMAYTRHWLGEREFALGAHLDQAERALAITPPATEEEETRLRGYIASLRAQDALSAGDLPTIIEQANLALELLPPGDLMGTEAGVSLGGAYWIMGDSPQAERAFAAGRDTARRCAKYLMAVPTATYAAWQQQKQGNLAQALHSYEEALAWATLANGRVTPVGGFPLLRIADLYYEWGDLPTALEKVREGHALSLRLNQADVVVDAYGTMAAHLWAAKDHEGAWESIRLGDQAARNRSPDLFLLTRLDSTRIRLWLAEERLTQALSWLETEGPDPQEPFSYHHDLHHLLLARIWLADDRPEETLNLALSIAAAAARASWVAEQIQALALAAAAAQQAGRTEEALTILRQALLLASPGRFVHSLLDADPLVARLLRQIPPEDDIPSDYLERLNAAAARGRDRKTAVSRQLIEQLSDRELEILQLIAIGLTNQQIASRLVLSLATVKWHASNIYGKLGVSNRNQAVVRARGLGLL